MNVRKSMLLVLFVGLLAACGTAVQPAAPAAQNASAAQDAPTGDLVTTVDGRTVAIGAGQPTALFFMAAWCGSCLAEADAWRQLIETGQAKDITVLAIDVDPSDTPESLQQFRSALPSDPLHWAMDAQGQLVRRFSVKSLDTTIILDGTGHEVYRDVTPSSLAQLQQALKGVQR